jgi:hypothetical protein
MIEGHDYTIYSNGPSGRARMYAFLALITAFLTPITQHTSQAFRGRNERGCIGIGILRSRSCSWAGINTGWELFLHPVL